MTVNSEGSPAMGLRRLGGSWVPVTDMAAALAFYGGVLGLHEGSYSANAHTLFVGDLEIVLVRASVSFPLGISFYVHDLDAAVAALHSRGVSAEIQGPSDVGALCDYARSVTLLDPDRNRVWLLEVTDEWKGTAEESLLNLGRP